MEEKIRVNRLPLLTYRYLHTNDTETKWQFKGRLAKTVFSDPSLVEEGGHLPAEFDGAGKETVTVLEQGEHYTITVPAGETAQLTVNIDTTEETPDYAGSFVVHLEKEAKLNLIWHFRGPDMPGTIVLGAQYNLDENAVLTSSILKEGLSESEIYDQRNTVLSDGAKAEFHSAEIGGKDVFIHSFAKLNGKKSQMEDTAVYAGEGNQHLDLFYNYLHYGEKSHSHIDVKGSLAESSKKIFRGTIDFKKGCKGAVGDEGDYAIQLDPRAHNISLPLLLCREDDVEGNHASSAGQLDQNVIYFLLSRGFSLKQARKIVIESMIRPLIDLMDPKLQEKTIQAVSDRVDKREA